MSVGIPHPLERAWTLYFDGGAQVQPKNPAHWKAYQKVATFRTIEEFWRVFANIVDVSGLDNKKDFFLFEEGVQPDWDDPANAGGGLWLVHCNECLMARNHQENSDISKDQATVNDIWVDTVLHTVGEQFEDSADIVGVALNLRRNGARLALWTRSAAPEATNTGRELKAILRLPPSAQLVGFASHADSKVAAKSQKYYWSSFKGTVRV